MQKFKRDKSIKKHKQGTTMVEVSHAIMRNFEEYIQKCKNANRKVNGLVKR